MQCQRKQVIPSVQPASTPSRKAIRRDGTTRSNHDDRYHTRYSRSVVVAWGGAIDSVGSQKTSKLVSFCLHPYVHNVRTYVVTSTDGEDLVVFRRYIQTTE